MLSIKQIESLLTTISPDKITYYFYIVLIVTFSIGLLSTFLPNSRKESTVPNLLTSLGILGTFTGIVVGLLNFNIDNIDQSINTLLAGMKTAFLTSVIGLLLSICLKITYPLLRDIIRNIFYKKNNKQEQSLDIDKIINNIYLQTDILQQQGKSIEQLTLSLGGDNESSVIDQLKLLRTDLSDKNKTLASQIEPIITNSNAILEVMEKSHTKQLTFQSALWDKLEGTFSFQNSILDKLENFPSFQDTILSKFEDSLSSQAAMLGKLEKSSAFQDTILDKLENFSSFQTTLWDKLENFSQLLSRSATEAVIQALNNVISDFNKNLTEQFGENFKELNKAVGDLLNWQVHYKQQLNEMINLFDKKISSLSQTEQAILNIENSAKSIPVLINELSEVIQFNQQQIKGLNIHLEAFSELKENAVRSIPEIQNQISLMLKNTSSANQEFIDVIKENSQIFSHSLSQSSEQFIESVTKSGQNFTTSLVTSSTQLTDSIDKNQQQLIQQSNILEQNSQVMVKHQKSLVEQQQKSIEQIMTFISEWQKKLDTHTTDVQQRFTQSLDKMMQIHMEENSRLMGRLEKESESALIRTGESIDKQIKALDKALETELERVIGDMGRALGSISGQFTKDYKSLVDAMNRIVSQSNKRGY
ncbi:MotA/TolQ/ExbB proton channel family protein [Avibacterium sp. 21-586]|uniref:MotA/TolQ/ExbB proton channel family protein n=1 Tax=Avibacterium sp. 21-586 TaxID=2911534 RepID=UPI0022479DC4|nr:MotA/TolQ/ExbB proton channel family protein [Avibacterium sp. 21-586]MCW9710144.1 MotA/TolQ/ExbB proton channel family protein [Avibacterium sp. 21-586]